MEGMMPDSVYDKLNAEFAPGFIFDKGSEDIRIMWVNARDAADLVRDELGLDTEEALDECATARVIDAWRVLLWGCPVTND